MVVWYVPVMNADRLGGRRGSWEGGTVIELKQILVPTDFSDQSASALRYGRALAEQFGAALHLLHVLDDSYLAWVAGLAFTSPPQGDLRDQMERSARDGLRQML